MGTNPFKAAEEAAATSPPPVAGVDYVEIANGQPFDTDAARVEVAEVFGYVCPFCAGNEDLTRLLLG